MFKRLSDEGTYVRSDGLWCRLVVDPKLSISHVGYAIGSHIGGAVGRNRLRRRLRAIMKTHQADLAPGLYLIGVGQAARTYRYSQLESSASRLISAIKEAIKAQVGHKSVQ